MAGIWAGLEDVTEDNGPLFYFPGSHKLPMLTLYDLEGLGVHNANYGQYVRVLTALMNVKGFKPSFLTLKKGTGLIWSSNLVHGGSVINKVGSTRQSQVTHYYFKNCVYYTPVYSNVVSGQLFFRDDVRDIRTGKLVPQTYNGMPIYPEKMTNGRTSIHLEPNVISVAEQKRTEEASKAERLGRFLTTPLRSIRKIGKKLRRDFVPNHK